MVLAPLAVLPSAANPYNFPKLLVTALALTIAVLAPRRGVLPQPVRWVMVAGALVFVVASITAVGSPVPALVGRWPRYEGLPVLGMYAACAWAGARLLGDPDPDRVAVLHRWVAISAIALGAFSGLDALGLSPLGLTSAERTGSLLGNATDQGLVGVMFFALMLAPTLRRPISLAAPALAASALVISLSGSRAAILAAVLVVVVHVVHLGRRRARPLAIALTGLALLVVGLPQSRERLLQGRTMESRFLAWQETAQLAGDHWFLGVGPSGYSDAIGRYQDAEWVRVVGAEAKPDSPHSWPLQALAAGGVPLLLLALALAGLIAHRCWTRLRDVRRPGTDLAGDTDADRISESSRAASDVAVGLVSAVAAYGSALLLNFTTPTTTGLAAFLTGAVIWTATPTRERAEAKGLAALTGVGAVLVLCVACLTEVALRNGADLAAAGRVAMAVDRFETVERLRPLDADARMLASQYLAVPASRGDVPAARQAGRRAQASLRASPDSYESTVALAVAQITLGRLRPALATLDDAVALYPFRGQAYTQRAIARGRLGDIEGAVLDLRRAMALRPDDPVPRRLLIELKLRLDDPSAAESSRQ